MSRSMLTFACEEATCLATLDAAPGTTGLLLVSGGNEVRSGAWAGQAQLAAQIAAAGHPVFRFDRRGVGDSAGTNLGFRHAGADLAAALAAFRAAQPQLRRIVALGNCDAASALMLNAGAGCDALVLTNPWTFEEEDAAAAAIPVHALRAHYRQRLSNPASLLRLLRGEVSFRRLASSLMRLLRPPPPPPPSGLVAEMTAGLARFTGPVRILLAGRDRTAQNFLAIWDGGDGRLRHCPGASHAFVEPEARAWLLDHLLDALASV